MVANKNARLRELGAMNTSCRFAIRKAVVALLLMMACNQTIIAQDSTTVGQLSDLNSANILKTAQLVGAQLDAKLDKVNVENGKSAPASVGGAGNHSHTPAPVVKGVFGANGKLFATFLYADGATVDAHRGSVIPGGYTVMSLDAEHVTLGKAGRRIEVGFSDTAPTTPHPQAQSPAGSFISGMPIPGMASDTAGQP